MSKWIEECKSREPVSTDRANAGVQRGRNTSNLSLHTGGAWGRAEPKKGSLVPADGLLPVSGLSPMWL